MKVHSVILLGALLATAFAAPADKKEDKEPTPNKEVDFVPPVGGSEDFPGGVVDVDAGGDGFFGNPFAGNPFPSLLSSIEGLMARMRQQLNQILGRLPDKPGDSAFPELHIPNLGDIDLGKGNTTSVTKVIDGHKVVINETQYQKADEHGGAFFKVRIIDVHPEASEETTEKDAEAVQPPRDRESVESINNEIPKAKDNEALSADNIETFDVDSPFSQKTTHIRRDVDWNNIRSVESIEDNNIDAVPPVMPQFHDLSNDIYVNELLAKAGAPRNPDAEVFDMADSRMPGNVPPRSPNMPIRYGYPQQGRYPNTFPMSDFEQLALQHGARPLFAPMPMPYYSHPMFPPNGGYRIPIQRSSPEAVTVKIEKSSSYSEKQAYRPASQAMKIQVISNEIPQTEMKREVASSSSAPQEVVNSSTTK